MASVRIHEHGDKVYIVGPATVYEPAEAQMNEFAFIENVRKMAPNPNLLWMHGQYVEADIPNGNKALWQSKELAIASLTPMFMPVNVMHDPSKSVGLIANVNLLTAEKDNVPRSRIESDLAVWRHLHADVAEEAAVNAKAGTLMQSMECFAPSYTCSTCGEGFMKQPGGAEEDTWCAHLKATGEERAARILERVVFTGVGLIFGTRGRAGADPQAYLTMEEVANLHQEVHERAADRTNRPKPKTQTRSKNVSEITITATEYAELNKRPTPDELAAARAEVPSETQEELRQAKADLEAEKSAHEAVKTELATVKTELETSKTEKAAQELKTERVGALGDAFLEALPESTRTLLTDEQAVNLDDAAWKNRIAELAALTKVDSDAKKDGSRTPPPADPANAQTAAELASLQVGGSGGSEKNLDSATVIGDLVGA